MGLEENRSSSIGPLIDSESITFDRISLARRLTKIQTELQQIQRKLFNKLIFRKEQLQFEHRVVSLGIFSKLPQDNDLKEIYEMDPEVIEIRGYMDIVTKQFDIIADFVNVNNLVSESVEI